MSVLIFRLNDVPEDEAAEARALLDRHGFAWHETGAGLFGVNVAGLWLLDEAERDDARAVLDAWQRERSSRLAAEHAALRAAGQAETTLARARRQPLRTLFYLAGIVALLYLVLMPFLTLGR